MSRRSSRTTVGLRILRDVAILAACFIPPTLALVEIVAESRTRWPSTLLRLLGFGLVGSAFAWYLQFLWNFIAEPLRGEIDLKDSPIDRDG